MSKALDIYNAFHKYRTRAGLQGLWSDGQRGNDEDNGSFFALDYMLLYATCEEGLKAPCAQVEMLRLSQDIGALQDGDTGMTWRRPGDEEVNSMDNVQAELVFGALFGSGDVVQQAARMMHFAENFVCTGPYIGENFERNRLFYHIAWVLNGFKDEQYYWFPAKPDKFEFRGWFGRSPGFMAFTRYRAGRGLSVFGALALWVGQFLGCFANTGNTDARRLPYAVWQVMKSKNLFWNLSYRLWCFILMRQYADGMHTVNGIYYKDPLHPIHEHQVKYIPANTRFL